MSITRGWIALVLLSVCAAPAMAQSFRVQCPTSTITHPDPTSAGVNNTEPAYVGPTYLPTPNVASDFQSGKSGPVNGAIKCQQISGGDGYATMADGHQTFLFSFGPLSGLANIAAGNPDGAFDRATGAVFPSVFNNPYTGTPVPGDPATTDGASDNGTTYTAGALGAFTYNGAIGITPDLDRSTIVGGPFAISSLVETGIGGVPPAVTGTVTATTTAPHGLGAGSTVSISEAPAGYNGLVTVVTIPTPTSFTYSVTTAAALAPGSAGTLEVLNIPITGHVDPRQIMDVGVMNGNIPAPLITMDEDDEFFLTLTNVGMIMRPDLFEQHTVHFHGYPNASAFYDGVPDASVAINIGGSFTYYYLAPDAGTYFWHCHITPPEHLQMGMVGQLYVRPRQDRVLAGTSLYTARQLQDQDLRTACLPLNDVLCTHNLPAANNNVMRAGTGNYAYNDGDGSTYYDVEYPLQIHGFDPNFHFVGMTFNPEAFSDMKDKYFLLNGRSYPDTVNNGPQATQSSDTQVHYSQPLAAVINIPAGKRALLRIADLDVAEYQTLASLGIRMQVIGYNAKLLRDQAGNNTGYFTNSITLGGGESLDVILDTCNVRTVPGDPSSACATGGSVPPGVYFLYTPQLDHLSNDAENFGGLMAEVHVN